MPKHYRPLSRILTTATGLAVLSIMVIKTLWKPKQKASNIQSVYDLNIAQSLLLASLAFAADILAIPTVLRNKPALRTSEFLALDSQKIASFDRIALRQNASRRGVNKMASDHLLRAVIGLYLLLLFDKKTRPDFGHLFALYAYTHALTYTTYTFSPLGPAIQNRYRPVVYYSAISTDEKAAGNNRNSRYSGHTSSAAAATFFLAKILADYHPNLHPAKRSLLYLLASLPPLTVGYFRMKALKHFPSDVALVLIMGAVFGVGIPEIYRSKH